MADSSPIDWLRRVTVWLLAWCVLLGPIGTGPVAAAFDDHCNDGCPCDTKVNADPCDGTEAAGCADPVAHAVDSSHAECNDAAESDAGGCVDDCARCSCCGGHLAVLRHAAPPVGPPASSFDVTTLTFGQMPGDAGSVFRPPRRTH